MKTAASSGRKTTPASITAPARMRSGGTRVGPEAVLCGGARVAPGARLERGVVWPGASLEGAHDGAIVTPTGTATVGGSDGRPPA